MASFFRMAAAALLIPAPAAALDLPADAPFVTAMLDGAPARLRVDFAAPGLVLLRPVAARRLGLRATDGSTVLVGPVTLGGRSGAAILTLDGRRAPVRVLWNDRAPTDDPDMIDGMVSPGALPVDSLRLIRGDPSVPVKHRTLPARFDAAAGLVAMQMLGGRRIELRLAPAAPETIASAAAGALIARRRQGVFDTVADSRRILFGISRPVRTLRLGTPLALPGGKIDRLLVRTADYGGGAPLPPIAPAADGDEIVVTGRAPGRARFRLNLGADLLGRCAVIGWTAATRRLTLDCP